MLSTVRRADRDRPRDQLGRLGRAVDGDLRRIDAGIQGDLELGGAEHVAAGPASLTIRRSAHWDSPERCQHPVGPCRQLSASASRQAATLARSCASEWT
jgi:hypothetical protein